MQAHCQLSSTQSLHCSQRPVSDTNPKTWLQIKPPTLPPPLPQIHPDIVLSTGAVTVNKADSAQLTVSCEGSNPACPHCLGLWALNTVYKTQSGQPSLIPGPSGFSSTSHTCLCSPLTQPSPVLPICAAPSLQRACSSVAPSAWKASPSFAYLALPLSNPVTGSPQLPLFLLQRW